MLMRGLLRLLIPALVALVVAPVAAHAQASIAGVVKDRSGGVMPGVTVEVASPALVEKTRSTVTDRSGLYQIIQLPAGRYTVRFLLNGFRADTRDGLELSGGVVAAVNGEMKVGAVAETIAVTGETPLVDVQSAVPDVVTHVVTQKVAEGVYCLTGGSYHSVAVEFKDHVVVIEAPQTAARAAAVFDAVRKALPDKPIKSVQLGGNVTRVFTDDTNTLELYWLSTDHDEGMLIAYVPKAKLLVEADVWTPPVAVRLMDGIRTLNLDVQQIAGLHGRLATVQELRAAAGQH